MLVGLLGILKAGGAYLPLDPDYPPERLAFMLADAGAAGAGHAGGAARARCRRMRVPRIVRLDADWPAIARAAHAPRRPRASQPHNTAYVIYTSGSTGTPKGVVVTHDGIVNYIAWALQIVSRWPRIESAVLQSHRSRFDASRCEICAAAASSAQAALCCRPEQRTS